MMWQMLLVSGPDFAEGTQSGCIHIAALGNQLLRAGNKAVQSSVVARQHLHRGRTVASTALQVAILSQIKVDQALHSQCILSALHRMFGAPAGSFAAAYYVYQNRKVPGSSSVIYPWYVAAYALLQLRLLGVDAALVPSCSIMWHLVLLQL
jgi:hypothetical protein